MSSILTQLMKESDDEDEVTIIDENKPDDRPKTLKDIVKEVALLRLTDSADYRAAHFSLAMVGKFAREKVGDFIDKGDKWTTEEKATFGQYIICILSLAGRTHYNLKNHFDSKPKKILESSIRNGRASEYLVEFCDEKVITSLIWRYFVSGYFKTKYPR